MTRRTTLNTTTRNAGETGDNTFTRNDIICIFLVCAIFSISVYMCYYGNNASDNDTENYRYVNAKYVNTNHTDNSNMQYDLLFVYVLDNTQYQCYLSYDTLTNPVKKSIMFSEPFQIAYEIQNPVNCVADIPVSKYKKDLHMFLAIIGFFVAFFAGIWLFAVLLTYAQNFR